MAEETREKLDGTGDMPGSRIADVDASDLDSVFGKSRGLAAPYCSSLCITRKSLPATVEEAKKAFRAAEAPQAELRRKCISCGVSSKTTR